MNTALFVNTTIVFLNLFLVFIFNPSHISGTLSCTLCDRSVLFHINSQNKQVSQMFKDTLRAETVVFLNHCHSNVLYLNFIYAVYFRFSKQPTLPQSTKSTKGRLR